MKEKKENLQQHDVISEKSERIIVKEVNINLKEANKIEGFDGVQTLYLHMIKRKEYPPLYRHAWGYAWVSTRKDGRDIFPVKKLTMKLSMPVSGGKKINDTDLVKLKKKKANADCRFGGTIFGNFTSYWYAEAEHPGYGKWHVSSRW